MAGWGPERWLCFLWLQSSSLSCSSHPGGALNDEWNSVFMTDLGWLLLVTSSGASASPAEEQEVASFSRHAPRNVHTCPLTLWHSQSYTHILQAHSFSSFEGSFLLCHTQTHLSLSFPLSLSLYLIYITLSDSLSISHSINKSFLGSSSRLNQPLCKHDC